MGYLMSITKYFGFKTSLSTYEEDLEKFMRVYKHPDELERGMKTKETGIKPQDTK